MKQFNISANKLTIYLSNCIQLFYPFSRSRTKISLKPPGLEPGEGAFRFKYYFQYIPWAENILQKKKPDEV